MILEARVWDDVLELRPLRSEDASAAYLAWLNDSEINQYLEIRFAPPDNLEALRDFFRKMLASETELMLGMFLRTDGRHIGNIKLGPIDWMHHSAEIGLLVGDRGEWGKGHAARAISLLSDYAFDVMGLAKLTAGCYSPNVGSTKAFLKAGFAQEGLRHGQWAMDDGQRCDGVLFGKLRPDLAVAGQNPDC